MKLLTKSYFVIIALFLISIFIKKELYGECKFFNNKACLPNLPPYTTNGQLMTAVFSPGESSTITSVFNKNTNYRLMVCYQHSIGEINFKVVDKKKTLIFDSKNITNDDKKEFPIFDFKTTSTKKLNIIVECQENPDLTQGDVRPSGCVTIVIGHKK